MTVVGALWTRQQMLEQHLREMAARARDSDRDPAGAETSGSVAEGDRARARQGIAHPLDGANP